VALDQPDDVVTAQSALLTAAELQHAERGAPAVRRRRILARSALRAVLARYLGTAPVAVRFAQDPDGKPRLAPAAGKRHDLFFSVARSADLCLVAVAASEVGVDVEKVERLPDLDAVAERYFAPEEASAIRARRSRGDVAAFFAYWTCKEALIKALGGGLATTDLDGFLIRFVDAKPVLAACRYADPNDWVLVIPPLDESWVAAVAVEHPRAGSPVRAKWHDHDFSVY
jgi:4'-phosphopantetheinyl transferase